MLSRCYSSPASAAVMLSAVAAIGSDISPGALPGSDEIHLQVEDATQKRGNALLIHGLTGTPSELASLAQYLNDRHFEVFVPRLSGHGNSIAELCKVPAAAWIADAERALLKFKDTDKFAPAIIGLSFGALLASHLAAAKPETVQKLVLISIPMKLSSRAKESALGILARMPDALLSMLPAIAKTKRRPGCHVLAHNAFRFHSVGAASRLVQIRKLVAAKFSNITADILILQDPKDHHVSAEVPGLLQSFVKGRDVKVEWLPGGEHELTLGADYEKVSQLVYNFLIT